MRVIGKELAGGRLMPYVRIVLTNLPVTRDEERQLWARVLEVMQGPGRDNSNGTMVSIEQVSKPEDLLREDKPRAVNVQIYTLPEQISAEARARITWRTIDMLKEVLGNTPDTVYQVDMDAAPVDSERLGFDRRTVPREANGWQQSLLFME